MPLPFIILGAAAAATALGGKKGYDGYQTKKLANELKGEALKKYEEGKTKFDAVQKMTDEKMEQLGTLELNIGKSIGEFDLLATELLANLNQNGVNAKSLNIKEKKLSEIKELSISATEYLGALAGGTAAGAAASFAIYSGVMAFAAASTGTPIAALSGVAATNAAMAALGGGSIAAGGWGMAGGALVLNTAAAAAIPLVAGVAYSVHANKALKNAENQKNEVDEILNNFDLIEEQLININNYVDRIYLSLNTINETFLEYFEILKGIHHVIKLRHSGVNIPVPDSEESLQRIGNGYAIAAIMTDIITTPLFKILVDETGEAILKDGDVQFETNESGANMVNENALDSVLAEQNEKHSHFLLNN